MGESGEHQQDLRGAERKLRAMQADLRDRMAQLTKPPERGSGVQFGKRIGDGTTEAVSRLSEVAVVDNLIATEQRVGRALCKIEAGTYGSCERCGDTIPPGRLRAAPESIYCVDCARAGAGSGGNRV